MWPQDIGCRCSACRSELRSAAQLAPRVRWGIWCTGPDGDGAWLAEKGKTPDAYDSREDAASFIRRTAAIWPGWTYAPRALP